MLRGLLPSTISPPQHHDAGVCWRKHATRCYAQGGGNGLVVKFNIPYRCQFGQHLRVIGTGEKLGEWDLQRAVPMTWTEGDVWTAELQLPAAAGGPLQLEYKYVVCSRDGQGAAWKPGDNFVLNFPTAAGGASVRVKDAWDEASREVQIEVVQGDGRARKARRRKAIQAAGEPADEVVAAIAVAADRALEQLDSVVSFSLDLLESGEDPASPELLAADRMVAAAAQRATALGKALDAAAGVKLLTDCRSGAGREPPARED